MRVFEALCSGSLLITDHAKGSGIEEMFCDKKHLVFYKDQSIEEQISYYLKNKKERDDYFDSKSIKELLEEMDERNGF